MNIHSESFSLISKKSGVQAKRIAGLWAGIISFISLPAFALSTDEVTNENVSSKIKKAAPAEDCRALSVNSASGGWDISKKIFISMSSIILLILLAGCGGGGGGGGGDSETSLFDGSISGTATKGPVADAVVTAFAVNMDGAKGVQIGAARTDLQGNFSMPVNDYSGPVLIEMTGGHYIDEATDQKMDVLPGTVMTSAIPLMESGSAMEGIQITPLTSMAQQMAANMLGGMTETNIADSRQALEDFFDVMDILHISPMDPTSNESATGADPDTMNYGMILAAMSQYASMQGVLNSSTFIGNMMDDASDGHMNGMMGPSQIMMGGAGGMMGGHSSIMQPDAGTMGLAGAMREFINSPMNQSGVTLEDMQALIDKLETSDGALLQ